jgi:hypothetical protein
VLPSIQGHKSHSISADAVSSPSALFLRSEEFELALAFQQQDLTTDARNEDTASLFLLSRLPILDMELV